MSQPPPRGDAAPVAAVDLFWLPLGAGGHFVRLNGRLYEALMAARERRLPFDLYHSALEVRLDGVRYAIETAWPIPDDHPASRGAVVQGPVGNRSIALTRAFRYEVRRWREGRIPDIDEAVDSPRRLSEDPAAARRVLDLVGAVPALVWGRDELGVGDMWNSNSVISWLLERAGLPAEGVSPPAGGRAPGWAAGIAAARRRG
jgi:hypothetical protein